MIVHSNNALPNYAVKPDANDVMRGAWFYVATFLSFLIFWLIYGIEDAGVKKVGIFYLIFSQKTSVTI